MLLSGRGEKNPEAVDAEGGPEGEVEQTQDTHSDGQGAGPRGVVEKTEARRQFGGGVGDQKPGEHQHHGSQQARRKYFADGFIDDAEHETGGDQHGQSAQQAEHTGRQQQDSEHFHMAVEVAHGRSRDRGGEIPAATGTEAMRLLNGGAATGTSAGHGDLLAGQVRRKNCPMRRNFS